MGKSWTEIDWKAPRPDLTELIASQKRIRFRPAPVMSAAADDLLRHCRSIFDNGGAQLAAFTVEDVDAAGHWFLSRNRFEEYGFVDCLITSDGVAEALPLVARGATGQKATFTWTSPLTLDGEIAAHLKRGGPYKSFEGSAAEAKRVGAAFSADIIGDRYEDFRIDYTYDSWSSWFWDIAWDATWVITDQRAGRVTLLCVTDTD